MKARSILFALVLSGLSQPALAQGQPKVDSFAAYQTCFDKAATELFASGVDKAAKLEKAARKRCKAEREQAIVDTTVQFLLGPKPTILTKADTLRAMERAVAQPVMKRLGFEGY
jgi:hypothetical protein